MNMLMILIAITAAAGGSSSCADQSQAGLTRCTSVKLQAVDAEMTARYQTLLGLLSASGVQRLRVAQRAWIGWRDRECILRTGGGFAASGTIVPMLMHECLSDLTQARSRQLQMMIHCPPPGLACPAG
jgi:uncharacterized protein YecT (DUF1311 family)